MNLPLSLFEKTVLIAGCGGGYDVVCALPVALQLARQACHVHLTSYSFTDLPSLHHTEPRGPAIIVSPETQGTGYCPEVHLSRWLAENEPQISPKIVCYSMVAVQPLKDMFNDLHQEHHFDALLVIDGGVDGIFRGDEYDLGSPSIDAISMVAGTLCSIPEKHYVMTAFGTEGVNKEVSHAQALERISEVIQKQGFHGACALVAQDPVTRRFDECIAALYRNTERRHHSNMVGSIQASYKGQFGDVAVTSKAEIHPIWVSPLTSLYWFLDLEKTARLKLYFDEIASSLVYLEVTEVLQQWMNKSPLNRGPKPSIPV